MDISHFSQVRGRLHRPHYQRRLTHLKLRPSEPVAHSLSAMCGLTGVTLFVLFLCYRKWCKDIRLGAPPSRIATIAALLSKSKFAAEKNLLPSDDLQTIEHKLFRLRFKLFENGSIDTIAQPQTRKE